MAEIELPPNNNMLIRALRERAMVRYTTILEQREEILSAFIAKYGLEPNEIEQVEQQNENETIWFVRKRIG